MNVWAVIPVRLAAPPKRRLAPAFTLAQRRELQQAMAADVLDAVSRVRELAGILIVTDTPDLRSLADRHGAELLVETRCGEADLDAALRQAAAHLIAKNVRSMLVVNGDLPALAPAEVRVLLAAHEPNPSGAGATLAGDRHGHGTNCLLCTPPDLVAFQYGPGSRARHVAAAARQGVAACVVEVRGAALDVDTVEDLAHLESSGAPIGAHTARFLRTLARKGSDAAAVALQMEGGM
jgi:2-phospho-L-lactate guanylyltransferase